MNEGICDLKFEIFDLFLRRDSRFHRKTSNPSQSQIANLK